MRARLLAWYDKNHRDLPWRHTGDPYRIWVSEIMLQQTRVAAVIDRYGIFLERFPDVRALAKADVAEVLALWSGLGYYRRARSLHQAARQIVASRGAMPGTALQWRALPGIGRYTAAAIASIASGEACAVVDGNVERVLRRMIGAAGIAIEQVWDVAEEWISPARPGDFNQALMELGATVCLPAAPQCDLCPLHKWCKTKGVLPARLVAARKRRDIAYSLALRKDSVYLKRRASSESLMPEMWELPEVILNGHTPEFVLRHAITVTDFRVAVVRTATPSGGGRWVRIQRVSSLPLTGLTRKILSRAGII
jgi:A/G-specific adenine glycosylase